jgi:hypothetical protein
MLLASFRLLGLAGLVTDNQKAARRKKRNAFHIAVLDLRQEQQVGRQTLQQADVASHTDKGRLGSEQRQVLQLLLCSVQQHAVMLCTCWHQRELTRSGEHSQHILRTED